VCTPESVALQAGVLASLLGAGGGGCSAAPLSAANTLTLLPGAPAGGLLGLPRFTGQPAVVNKTLSISCTAPGARRVLAVDGSGTAAVIVELPLGGCGARRCGDAQAAGGGCGRPRSRACGLSCGLGACLFEPGLSLYIPATRAGGGTVRLIGYDFTSGGLTGLAGARDVTARQRLPLLATLAAAWPGVLMQPSNVRQPPGRCGPGSPGLPGLPLPLPATA
jgi:hypothetical protein